MKIDAFLEHERAFGALSAVTLHNYENTLRRFERETCCIKQEPALEAVQDYVAKMRDRGLSNTSITVTLYALKRYANWAKLDLFGSREYPAIRIPGFEFKPPMEVPTEEAVARMFKAATTPLERLLVALPYTTGSRISEITNLDWKDVDWKTGMLSIKRKGRRERREQVMLSPDTLKLLKEYVAWAGVKRGKLFSYSYSDLHEWFTDLAKRAKVKFPKGSLFHNLRHSFVLHQRAAGVGWADISQAIGHTSINTTLKIYGALQPKELRDKLKKPPWEQVAK